MENTKTTEQSANTAVVNESTILSSVLAALPAGQETNVDVVEKSLAGKVSRHEILDVLRELRNKGEGKLIVGRHGRTSRFILGVKDDKRLAANATVAPKAKKRGRPAGMKIKPKTVPHHNYLLKIDFGGIEKTLPITFDLVAV